MQYMSIDRYKNQNNYTSCTNIYGKNWHIYTLIYIYCHFLKNLKIIKGCRWQLKALIYKTHLHGQLVFRIIFAVGKHVLPISPWPSRNIAVPVYKPADYRSITVDS